MQTKHVSRRWSPRWPYVMTVILAGGLAVAFAVSQLQASDSQDPRSRTFQVTYSARIDHLPADAGDVQIWVPLAKDREHQRILERRIDTPHPYQISREATHANDILHIRLVPPVPHSVDVAIHYTAAVEGDSERTGRGLRIPRETLARNLVDEPFMVVDQTVTTLAQETTAGISSDMGKARAIYEYVIASMHYDKETPGWGNGDTLRACRLGKGNCTDFHSLFISMARAIDIPARFVIGASVPEGSQGDIAGYHCWAEFYVEEAGWVPIDASQAWKHPDRLEYYFGTVDPNRLLISVGRNLQLVPAQAGKPVNIFINPYVEVDGRPGGSVEVQYRFRSLSRKGEEA